MKKTLYSILMLVGVLVAFTSCEKEDIGNTATVETAGEWYVVVDAADANGNLYVDSDGDSWEDPFGVGRIHMMTYNTAANDPNEMIVTDMGNFWDFTVKVNCDQNDLTFSTNTTENNNMVEGYEDINVTITGGKIIKGGAVTPSGSKADYIEFYVSFSDDSYPATYGYKNYKVSGYRYTGFVDDEE